MHMTTAQLQTLKAFIAATPALAAQPNNSDGNTEIAKALNLSAAPAYWCYKVAVTQEDIQAKPSIDATFFDWASAGGFISRSQGERDAYGKWSSQTVNPSYANNRAAFDDMFNGSGVGAVANRAHWRAVIRRLTTVFEKLYVLASTGNTGARGSTTNPDTLALDADGGFLVSPVDASHVGQARDLP